MLPAYRENEDVALHAPGDNIFIFKREVLLWLSASGGATPEKAAEAIPCLLSSPQVALVSAQDGILRG